MPRRLLLLVNPTAACGRALAVAEGALKTLESAGFKCERALSVKPGELVERARSHAASSDVVLAAGGDGTVREVASGLVQSGAPHTALAVLPVGTGNDFATQLGVRTRDQAVLALRQGVTRAVDVIEVRRREGPRERVDHALLFAAAGFAAELLRLTGPRVKRVFGRRLSYSVGFFRALVGFRAPRMTVRADAGEFTSEPIFHVCAGNSEWAGGGAMRLSPGARMDDGRLELCWIRALSRFEAFRCFPMLVRGTFPRHPKVRYFSGEGLAIEGDQPAPLALDGDVVGETPARFHVLPGALRVVVPDLGTPATSGFHVTG